MDELERRVVEGFRARYGTDPTLVVRAPGRVNLLGEHTDYNEGFVFPVAIDRALVAAARQRDDETLCFHALDFGAADEASVRAIATPAAGIPQWARYPRGVAAVLQRHGHPVPGADITFAGTVPQGSGLSSSAALEVAIAKALDALGHGDLDPVTLALLCQEAENTYVGVQCGIMDQFISALGKADHALLIDCRSLEHRVVPLPLESQGVALVVVDSGVPRGLVDSEFNARRAECRAAVEALRKALARPQLGSLRDVTPADLASLTGPDTTLLRRARHVVSENARVLEGVAALEAGDLATFGRLMNASHASLRDDYAVSTPELDDLVARAQAMPGVLGARLTGAGFGGCTVHLVRRDALPRFESDVVEGYARATGRTPRMWICRASEGMHQVEIPPAP